MTVVIRPVPDERSTAHGLTPPSRMASATSRRAWRAGEINPVQAMHVRNRMLPAVVDLVYSGLACDRDHHAGGDKGCDRTLCSASTRPCMRGSARTGTIAVLDVMYMMLVTPTTITTGNATARFGDAARPSR